MPETTHSDIIPATNERVFALITDPQKLPAWLPFCRAAEIKSQGLRKGAKLMVTFPSGVTEFEVVDFAPPNTLGWVDRIGRKGQKTLIRLDFAGAQTKISFREVSEAQGAAGWLKTQINNRRDPVFSFRAAVQNLRKLVTT